MTGVKRNTLKAEWKIQKRSGETYGQYVSGMPLLASRETDNFDFLRQIDNLKVLVKVFLNKFYFGFYYYL